MWLLSTATAELKFFNDPEAIPGGYAILSHVWLSEGEDTFQAVRAISERRSNLREETKIHLQSSSAQNQVIADLSSQLRQLMGVLSQHPALTSIGGSAAPEITSAPQGSEPSTPTTVSEAKTTDSDDPRDLISPKVCAFLKLAQRDGYEWAWSDTCCIDKTSSAELTEAINSMFRYYQLSDVCYVYLADVPPGPFGKLFAQSRWHTRGWTLQELIAPKTVLFMAADWTLIGSKYELADELERVAKVPVEVLRFDKDVAEVSVAARMSWAARRKTTRVEDEAYCLFGLFGINMPTLYGEGQNAFYRLQQEIMRTSIDTSLVAWGTVTPVSSVEELLRRARMAAGHLQGYEFLLAPRVECYRYHAYTEFDESRRFLCAQEREDGPSQVPTFEAITPHGVLCLLPMIQLDDKYAVASLSCSLWDDPFWIMLMRDPNKNQAGGRRLYHCVSTGSDSDADRLFKPDNPPLVKELDELWEWMRVYIPIAPPYRAEPSQVRMHVALFNRGLSPPFRLRLAYLKSVGPWELTSLMPLQRPVEAWDGSPPAVLLFTSGLGVRMSITLGCCGIDGSGGSQSPTTSGTDASGLQLNPYFAHSPDPPPNYVQYASVRFFSNDTALDEISPDSPPLHSCEEDHIARWTDSTKVFRGEASGWGFRGPHRLAQKIWFTKSTLDPMGRSLELHTEQLR